MLFYSPLNSSQKYMLGRFSLVFSFSIQWFHSPTYPTVSAISLRSTYGILKMRILWSIVPTPKTNFNAVGNIHDPFMDLAHAVPTNNNSSSSYS